MAPMWFEEADLKEGERGRQRGRKGGGRKGGGKGTYESGSKVGATTAARV